LEWCVYVVVCTCRDTCVCGSVYVVVCVRRDSCVCGSVYVVVCVCRDTWLAIEIAGKDNSKLGTRLTLPPTPCLLHLRQDGRQEQQPYVRGTRVKKEMRVHYHHPAARSVHCPISCRRCGGGHKARDLSNCSQLGRDDAC